MAWRPSRARVTQAVRWLYARAASLRFFMARPGTGKTLAAHVLAEVLTRDILRVDLGQAVSKYIGETEKNLAAVFARAEQTGAVLFSMRPTRYSAAQRLERFARPLCEPGRQRITAADRGV
jgi:hypothetical protein